MHAYSHKYEHNSKSYNDNLLWIQITNLKMLQYISKHCIYTKFKNKKDYNISFFCIEHAYM